LVSCEKEYAMTILSDGVIRVLKPVVGFMAGTVSDLMSTLALYGLLYIALADRILPLLTGAR
jgi:hypothetical protein